MRVSIIANPVAGVGKTTRHVERFTEILQSRGHDVEVLYTCEKGDGCEKARLVDEKAERLVIAGGDGTVNEVLNGLENPSLIPILHLPSGTANQLANHLGLPSRLPLVAQVLEDGNTRMLDMGVVGKHRFLLEVSAGFDAAVTEIIKKGEPTL